MDVGGVQSGVHFSHAKVVLKANKQGAHSRRTEEPTPQRFWSLYIATYCGPIKTMSIWGARYILTFNDDFLRKIWMYVLKKQSVGKVQRMERQSKHVVKARRTNNDGEFPKLSMIFWAKHDIAWQTLSPYMPQQNGVVEQENQTIVEMAWSMNSM